jgi:hypothetical protein
MDALAVGITCTKVNYIWTPTFDRFFDEVSQDWLNRFLEHRIGNRRITRLVRE